MTFINRLSCFFIFFSLLGCDSSSNDDNKTPAISDVPAVTKTYETTKVKFRFNLPSSSRVMDTKYFSNDDTDSFSGSTATWICDSKGERIALTTYFLKVDKNKWDVYFQLKNNGLNIVDGEIGGLGQYKASLEFDNEGNFVRQHPYLINTFDIEYEDLVQTIEFDFYSNPSTSLDFPFMASLLDANGCK